MLVYKIDVLRELKDAGYNQTRIHKEKTFAQSDVQKMREHRVIGINTLERLCRILELQPGAIIKYIPDEVYEERKTNGTLLPCEIIREKKEK